MTNETNQTIVLYHAPCYDGFGAAYAAWLSLGDRATYVPCVYGKPFDHALVPNGARVYMLDFSLPRDEILELAERAAVLIIDHHVTALHALGDLPYAHFDMDHSGAVLAWEYFHPGEPVPDFFRYIEDRDLWRFALEGSEEVAACLRAYPYDFSAWAALHARGINAMRRDGAVLLRGNRTAVSSIVDAGTLWRDVGGYRVPTVNTSWLFSEVANELLLRHPDTPFACAWFVRADGKEQWSLRSRAVGAGLGTFFDVSAVAKMFGGGGHPAASGFQVRAGAVEGWAAIRREARRREIRGTESGTFNEGVRLEHQDPRIMDIAFRLVHGLPLSRDELAIVAPREPLTNEFSAPYSLPECFGVTISEFIRTCEARGWEAHDQQTIARVRVIHGGRGFAVAPIAGAGAGGAA